MRPVDPTCFLPALVPLLLLASLSIPACHTSGLKETGVDVRTADPDYFQELKDRINRNWGPSRERVGSGTTREATGRVAKYARSVGGLVVVSFSIGGDGSLVGEPAVEESSGSEFLDEDALRAIRAAAPFSPIPRSLSTDRIDLIWRFEYQASPGEGE